MELLQTFFTVLLLKEFVTSVGNPATPDLVTHQNGELTLSPATEILYSEFQSLKPSANMIIMPPNPAAPCAQICFAKDEFGICRRIFNCVPILTTRGYFADTKLFFTKFLRFKYNDQRSN